MQKKLKQKCHFSGTFSWVSTEHNLHTPLLSSSLTGHTRRADSHCSIFAREHGTQSYRNSHRIRKHKVLKPTKSQPTEQCHSWALTQPRRSQTTSSGIIPREEAVANFMYFTITINRDEYCPHYLIGQPNYTSRSQTSGQADTFQKHDSQKAIF